MTRATLMVLVATAMAVLLAGCDSTQKEDQGSSQHKSDPTTNETLVGRCADNASTGGQQEEASGGEVSNGKIAFSRRSGDLNPPKGDIYVIDEEGTHETPLTHTAQFVEAVPVWSPDGQKIAFVRGSDIYVMNADGTNQTQLAENVSGFLIPAWSPDGQKIAFTRHTRSGRSALYMINADGTNEVRLNTSLSKNSNDRTQLGTPVWSPDGEKIAFFDWGAEDGGTIDRGTINVINADGSERKELIDALPDEPGQAWSPDGERIAFVKQADLYVINANGSGLRRLANTTELGAFPAWSPDGAKIAFLCPAASGAVGIDLCVINADGTEWARLTLKGHEQFVSWSSG